MQLNDSQNNDRFSTTSVTAMTVTATSANIAILSATSVSIMTVVYQSQ
jgi:hypothetical protein